MAFSTSTLASPPTLPRSRILHDIHDLISNPYPNIELRVHPDNLTSACLFLWIPQKIQLDITFPKNYPLSPPSIKNSSDIKHPNIFGSYICASILNVPSEWTPAYTLKGVAIQLLSFFTSDRLEQVTGGEVDLRQYQRSDSPDPNLDTNPFSNLSSLDSHMSNSEEIDSSLQENDGIQHINRLPNELLLDICEYLDAEKLLLFAKAWSRIGLIITQNDILRSRELICFCSKKDYTEVSLGVGVRVLGRGKGQGTLQSEFDLLSEEAFTKHHVRRSIQGLPFDDWLPLPISSAHWNKVKGSVSKHLNQIANRARLGNIPDFKVLFHFMNDVVVKLNQTESHTSSSRYSRATSSLTHASEKAIESYFHLFHLLLCLAVENPATVRSANDMITKFMSGRTSKTDCPSLGHLLVAALISTVEMTEIVIKAILREAITRNVVWMLDKRGANMPSLSYLEPSPVSEYRLQKTFEASRTSYRLLMFLNLFRTTCISSPQKPLRQLRDEAFQRHGAPPLGKAQELAESIKKIHLVNDFPSFLKHMSVKLTTKEWFCTFLKQCVRDSMTKGYSVMPISEEEAKWLRERHELSLSSSRDITFFPEFGNGDRGDTDRGRGRGAGRGRGRARGRGN